MSTQQFTLVELLVVTAIIAVLAALLLPTLGSARTRAAVAVCLSQKRQIHLGSAMYAGDFNGLIPSMALPLGPWPPTPGTYRYDLWENARYHSEQNPQNSDPHDRYYPMGKLYMGGYVPSGRMFFCTDYLPDRTNTAPSPDISYELTWFRDGIPRVEHPTDTGRFWTTVYWLGAWFYEGDWGSSACQPALRLPFTQARRIDAHHPADPLAVDAFFMHGSQWGPTIPHRGTGVTRLAYDGRADFLMNPVFPPPEGTPERLYTYSGHPWGDLVGFEMSRDHDVLRRLDDD